MKINTLLSNADFNFNFAHLNNEVNFNNNLCDKTIMLAPLISEATSKYSFVIGSNSTSLIISQHKTELGSHADTCTMEKCIHNTHS